MSKSYFFLFSFVFFCCCFAFMHPVNKPRTLITHLAHTGDRITPLNTRGEGFFFFFKILWYEIAKLRIVVPLFSPSSVFFLYTWSLAKSQVREHVFVGYNPFCTNFIMIHNGTSKLRTTDGEKKETRARVEQGSVYTRAEKG